MKTGSSLPSRFGGKWGQPHGGNGGNLYTATIGSGENIIIVQGKKGTRIDSIEFITDNGKVFGPWGGSGGSPFVSSRPNCRLSYLSGTNDDKIRSIFLHWEC